jgi:hypothetical protein
MDDYEQEEPESDESIRKMFRNSQIVSAACDRYFARKGLRCYDLKGNEINPLTKQQLNKPKCKPTSKRSKN